MVKIMNKKICHLIIFIFTGFVVLWASDTITTTLTNNKTVRLFSNGTWDYVSDSKDIKANKNTQIPEKRKFDHPPFQKDGDFNLESTYDKFKDHTVVKIELKISDKPDELILYSFFHYNGTIPSIPLGISFGFHSISEDWQYLHNSDLSLIVDNKRISIGELERDGTVGEGYVIEHLNTVIPIKQFLEIINAKSVEGKLFVKEFKLTDAQLEALREYASLMN
jgi:hypothetical protein